VEPGVLFEQGLADEAQGGCVCGEGSDDGEDGVLAVHGVCHAFVGEAACGGADAVEAVEGGGDADGAADVSAES